MAEAAKIGAVYRFLVSYSLSSRSLGSGGVTNPVTFTSPP